jgi:hypothetical protein
MEKEWFNQEVGVEDIDAQRIKELLADVHISGDLKEKIKSVERVKESIHGLYREKEESSQEKYNQLKESLESVLPEGYSFEESSEMSSGNWRGDRPDKTLLLLSGEDNELSIKSDKPNVARVWSDALRHGVDFSEDFLPLAMAMKFKTPEDWTEKREESQRGYERSIRCVDGRIRFEDIEGLVVRLAAPGRPLPPRFLKLVKDQNE